ncbi:GntR family transcriptional regulator [Ochrobactrum sp. Marseille-Q0166]|uniref:GntR family transcriptional regulator n=1 Tax=Ochrobactrum sp. Marseille-Q0166 TaxID=2761105 RepID=UPI001655C087|nr:GntR family transcriptional regulator [Ochrobactrum sp. Marseille-Q0166]MBC8719001.1 GntR family transcriptional regulator [Ochrobactrum sp. Marseille-Q0166]
MHFLDNQPIDNSETKAGNGGARWHPVYQGLRDAVVSHQLLPGTKLPEDELATIYSVSRAVVRSALQALAHDRLVRLEPNRGAFVAEPSRDEAREVFEARTLIEPEVAAIAAKVATPSDIAKLRKHLQDEHEALHAGRDSDAIRLSARFHLDLAEIAGHSILRGFVTELLPRSSLIIALYWQRRETTCESHAHNALVDSIEKHRPNEASFLMKAHILDLLDGLNLNKAEKSHKPLSDILK